MMNIESEVNTQLIGDPVETHRLKLLGVLEQVMSLSPNSLTCDQHLGELGQWDSLTELDFVLAVEEQFGVTLEIDAVVNCELVGQLVDLAVNSAPTK